MDRIKRIDKYLLLEKIGNGGFGSVHKCRDDESGRIYAIKIGKETINDEYYEKAADVDAMTHMEEWRAYKAVKFGKGVANRRGIPNVIETGPPPRDFADRRRLMHRNCEDAGRKDASLPRDAAAWKVRYPTVAARSMCDVTFRNLQTALSDPSFTREQYFQVAHSAIESLAFLHEAGYVHRDIKVEIFHFGEHLPMWVIQPANFCFGRGNEEENDENACPLFIMDLGLATEVPKAPTRDRADFVGTPDYASTFALRGHHQSYRDDMESLAYTLLEMYKGDLPWFLTGTPSVEINGWTHQNLNRMATRRERKWKALVRVHAITRISLSTLMWEVMQEKRIPLFLVSWMTHCKSLGMVEKPDYSYFHRLIEGAQEQHRAAQKNKRKSSSSSPGTQGEIWSSPKRRCQHEE